MTNEKLDNVWKDDLLSRRVEAEGIIRFLVRRTKERSDAGKGSSFVLNLDAGWGYGKTFFLKHLQSHLELGNYPVVYINAWEDDYSEDAFIPIVSGIRKTLDDDDKYKEIKQGLVKATSAYVRAFSGSIVSSLIAKYIGINGDDWNEATKKGLGAMGKQVDDICSEVSDRLVDRYEENRQSVDGFKKALQRLVSALQKDKKQLPLFILVDELDRCRPTYAIEVLERVKHLFDVDNVVFIIATNSDQLQHSVRAVYGNNFDATQYLSRFFDRRYQLAESSRKDFIDALFKVSGINTEILVSPLENNHTEFFAGVADIFDLSLRGIQHCFDTLHTITSLWETDAKIQLFQMLPLIFAHYKNNKEYIERFESPRRDNDVWIAKHMKDKEAMKCLHFYPKMCSVFAQYVFGKKAEDVRSSLKPLMQQPGDTKVEIFLWRQMLKDVEFGQVELTKSALLISTYPDRVRNACRWDRIDVEVTPATQGLTFNVNHPG